MKPPPFIGAPTLREVIWCIVGGLALVTLTVLWG